MLREQVPIVGQIYTEFLDCNLYIENKDYFLGKWQERFWSDNLLPIYKAERFIRIITEAKPIDGFDIDLYFRGITQGNGYTG